MGEPPPPTRDPEEVRRLADEILDRAEFAPPGRSWLQHAVDWVVRQLERLFGGGDGAELGGGGATGGSTWFTAVVLVVAAVAVVAAVLALRGTWRRRRARGGADDDVDVDVTARRSASDWEAVAARLEAEGRWKEAMRARFGALVERLVEGGLVADVPGRTSGEYRGDVRAALPEAADDFAAAADLFERAWYGDLPTGPDERDRFAAGAARVVAAAGGRT